MGIENAIARMCNQTAVYWGSPVNDGYGGKTFATPVEITCRWEDKIVLVRNAQGSEFISKAVVYVLQDLDEEGMLYLGTLTDLGDLGEINIDVDNPDIDVDNPDIDVDDLTSTIVNPITILGAYIIKQFDKSPNMKGTEFVRKVYL